MAMNEKGNKILEMIKKYKYVALILVLGLVFMLIPAKDDKTELDTLSAQEADQRENISSDLEKILSEIDGAGEVKVFVTVSKGEQIIYQTDLDSSQQADASSQRVSTILVTDAQKNETGLVKQRIGAIYQGAVVLCHGADKPSVKLAVTEAVSKVTGLGSDKICVFKMK